MLPIINPSSWFLTALPNPNDLECIFFSSVCFWINLFRKKKQKQKSTAVIQPLVMAKLGNKHWFACVLKKWPFPWQLYFAGVWNWAALLCLGCAICHLYKKLAKFPTLNKTISHCRHWLPRPWWVEAPRSRYIWGMFKCPSVPDHGADVLPPLAAGKGEKKMWPVWWVGLGSNWGLRGTGESACWENIKGTCIEPVAVIFPWNSVCFIHLCQKAW